VKVVISGVGVNIGCHVWMLIFFVSGLGVRRAEILILGVIRGCHTWVSRMRGVCIGIKY